MAYQENGADTSSKVVGVNYRNVVHAMFANPDYAARAVVALIDIGVHQHDISILIKDPPPNWDENLTSSELLEQATEGLTVTTGHDAAVGAAKGAAIGLGVGALAAVAALAIPGVGLVIGGGALATAAGGALAAGAAGAVSGAVYGYLRDQGIDDSVALAVEGDYQKGGALVSVTTPSGEITADTVNKVLAKYQDQWYMVHTREEEDSRASETGERVYGPYPPKPVL